MFRPSHTDVFEGVQGSGPLGHIREDNARCHLFANWPNMSANSYPLSGNPPIVSPIAWSVRSLHLSEPAPNTPAPFCLAMWLTQITRRTSSRRATEKQSSMWGAGVGRNEVPIAAVALAHVIGCN